MQHLDNDNNNSKKFPPQVFATQFHNLLNRWLKKIRQRTQEKNAEFKQQIHAALREFVDAFPYTKRDGVKRMERKKSARL